MAEQNELPVVADVFTMQAFVPGERAVHYSRLLVEVPRGTKLTDHAAATARIAALEAKVTEQAMQYLALDTQHQQALAQLEEARKDARRLDSGVILMHERDEFGEDYTVEHRGVNLRAAIDSAMAADGGGK